MRNKSTLTLSFIIFFCTVVFGQVPEEGLVSNLEFDASLVDAKGCLKLEGANSVNYVDSRRKKPAEALYWSTQLPVLHFSDSMFFSNGKKDNSFTLSFWINSKMYPGYLISRGLEKGTSKKGFGVSFNDSARIQFNSESNIIYTKAVVADGHWHNVTLCIDQLKKIFIYIDGKKDTSCLLDKTLDLGRKQPLILGDILSHPSFFFFIDEFRMYDRALFDAEVNQLYYNHVQVNSVEVDLDKPNSANSSCAININITPDGEHVRFNSPKFHKMEGYSIRLIDQKHAILKSFSLEKTDTLIDLQFPGDDAVCFMEVFNPKGMLVQVYRLNLNF